MIPLGGMLTMSALIQKLNVTFMQAVGFSIPGQTFSVRLLDLEDGIN